MSRVYVGPYLRFKVPVTVNTRMRRGCPICKQEWNFPFCPNHGASTVELEIESKSPARTWQGCETKSLLCLAVEGDSFRDKEVFYIYGTQCGEKVCGRDCWWQWTPINFQCKSVDLQLVSPSEEQDWFLNYYSQDVKKLVEYFGDKPGYCWGLVEPML